MSGVQAVAVELPEEERQALGKLAIWSIEHGLSGAGAPRAVPAPKAAVLHTPMGAFVTLTRHGHLRGCIGSMVPRDPLYLTVAAMAHAAAFRDHRFTPLRAEEWPDVALEISVLSPLSLCPDPQRIEVGRHGLLLSLHGRSGVFLPQVPVEQHWDLASYLEQLCGKAGLPAGSWRAPGAELYWYEALVFAVHRHTAD